MLATLKKRYEREDEGFTLIELMVVVLIIGILLAIAVPTFLNAQNNAKTKAATSNLRSSLSAVKTVYADKQTYNDTTLTVAVMEAAEPSLDWVNAAAVDAPNEISYDGTDTLMALATRSKLGTCFLIIDSVASSGGGTTYYKSDATAATCTATTTAPTTGYTSGSSPSDAGW